MTPPAGLELLRRLIDDHLVDRGGSPLLVPCLHEELDRDIELLSAGARRCNGMLYNLSSDDGWEPPQGPISQDRLDLLHGILQSSGDVLPSGIDIQLDQDGQVVASVQDGSVPSEASLVPILRAAAVVASSAYDVHDFVVTAVVTAPTDRRRRELLWSILTINPQDLSLKGSPTTVVPILGAYVDPDVDYRRKPDVRYVVRWDRVIRRSQPTLQHAIDSIGDHRGRPIVLFLGAGASASSGIQLGNRYRDIALKALLGNHKGDSSAEEAFFDLLHERQHFLPGESDSRTAFAEGLTLERVLRETFSDLGYRPRTDSPVIQEIIRDCAAALDYIRPGRQALRDLAARLRGQLIIMTVNFDQLIETDLGTESAVYYLPTHFENRRDDLVEYVKGNAEKPVPVLKLHGSIEDPDSLIATIDTTSAGLQDDVRNALNDILATADSPITWVWIGCSMRDRDMNLWLGGLSADALDEWWVDPLPGQALDDFFHEQRAPKWNKIGQQLKDRLIIDSADGFLRALAERVRLS